MKMHKLSLIAALALGGLLACYSPASAQNTNGPRKGRGFPSAEQRTERLSQQLNLTSEQKSKVKALFEDFDKKRHEIFADTSVPLEQRREKMIALHEEQTKKMKEILTPEQFEQWQKMMPQHRPGGPNGHNNGQAKKKAQ